MGFIQSKEELESLQEIELMKALRQIALSIAELGCDSLLGSRYTFDADFKNNEIEVGISREGQRMKFLYKATSEYLN